ncbi:MAG: hypothetical protein PUF50_05410 [Erysipelotrichaceae bacterium]|nr:hypothetical protein [Erysipelotrichaceae bacterium]
MRANTILQMVLMTSFLIMLLMPVIQYIAKKSRFSLLTLLLCCELLFSFVFVPQWISSTFLEISCSFLFVVFGEFMVRYIQKCAQNRHAGKLG